MSVTISGIKKMEFTKYSDYADTIWMRLITSDTTIDTTIHFPLESFISQLRDLANTLEANHKSGNHSHFLVIEAPKDAPRVEVKAE